jgi:hypothetical protein
MFNEQAEENSDVENEPGEDEFIEFTLPEEFEISSSGSDLKNRKSESSPVPSTPKDDEGGDSFPSYFQ